MDNGIEAVVQASNRDRFAVVSEFGRTTATNVVGLDHARHLPVVIHRGPINLSLLPHRTAP